MAQCKASSSYGKVCYEMRLSSSPRMPRPLASHDFEFMDCNSPCHCGIMALWFGFLAQRFWSTGSGFDPVSSGNWLQLASLALIFFCIMGKLPPLFPVFSEEFAVNGSVTSYDSGDLVFVSVSFHGEPVLSLLEFQLFLGDLVLLSEPSYNFDPCQDRMGPSRWGRCFLCIMGSSFFHAFFCPHAQEVHSHILCCHLWASYLFRRGYLASVSFDCPESIQHLFWAPRDVIEYQRQDIVESIEIFNLYWDLDCFFSKMDYRELQEIQRALRSHKDVVQGNRSSILTSTAKIHEQDNHVTTQNCYNYGNLTYFSRNARFWR